MSKGKRFFSAIAGSLLICFGAAVPATSADVSAVHSLHIDIPVKLERADVVFNVDHLALLGDMPFAIAHMDLLAKHLLDWNSPGRIVAVFHSDAGHVTLDDRKYNAGRNVTTGNPYKAQIAALMKQGVQIELCGSTAKAHSWVNADLIPGVKVDTDAIVSVTELMQKGYVQITE
jgi:intracellular sulfur oxidation DsrE/DsrF family protein